MARLAALLQESPLGDPLARELVVLPGKGMERWLELRLAERLGIWANARQVSTRALVELLCDAALGEPEGGTGLFDAETLLWALAPLLRSLAGQGEVFKPVAAFLREDEHADRLVSLAARVANTFDHYLIYRPELLEAWQCGELTGLGDDEAWQAPLWRELYSAQRARGGQPPHERLSEALAALLAGSPKVALPERVSLFALPTLPPRWLELFAAAGSSTQVHLFHLAAARGSSAAHPLVASMGELGRDLHNLLDERGLLASAEALFEPAGGASALHALQDAVLEGSVDEGAPSDDRSLTVHAVHSRKRELEVLHDQLLRAFEDLPGLSARDVVVLVPDVEVYAPLVPAVFAGPLLCRVADRSARGGDEVVDAFGALLDVLPGRLPLAEVLDLLARRPLLERCGLRTDELERASAWLRAAGVRWGADAAHREQVGQPALDDNTWRFGLQRLLLGYATAGDGASLFGDVVPYDDIEGGDGAPLGGLVAFLEALFEARRGLFGVASVGTWGERLTGLVGRLLPVEAASTQRLASMIAEMTNQAARMGFDEEVGFGVVREQLRRGLEGHSSSQGLLGEGVTLCRLGSLRGVPARVVCVLGLEEGVFPRSRRELSFDLMPRAPRRGDRNPRDDDRDAFLQALLSARDRVLLSYQGQSLHADEERPPSVVLEELLAQVGGAPCRHPMHAFSPRYFTGDEELFSYDAARCEAAKGALGQRSPRRALLFGPLPARDDEGPIALADLVALFDHPSRHFVRNVLGLSLPDTMAGPGEREPIALNGLEEWAVGDELLRRTLQGAALDDLKRVARRDGRLPLGTPGEELLLEISSAASGIAAERASLGPQEPLEPVAVDLVVGGRRILGTVRDLWPMNDAPGARALVQATYSKLRVPKLMRIWVRLLALNAARAEGEPPYRARLVGSHERGTGPLVLELAADEGAAVVLADLVALYGLAQRRPLLLFKAASVAYAESVAKQGPEKALAAAAARYAPGREYGGDLSDPFVAELYGDADPLRKDPFAAGDLTLDFADLARRVYGPLLSAKRAL
jgi:exodeoxyribonuclease V gamma subunit